jgi:hypothetical protein
LPLTTGVTGALPVANGGTGASATVQALSGPGAVNITSLATAFTSTAAGNALTLADGAQGQLKTIVYVAEAAGGDTGILTPANLGSGTTVTLYVNGTSVGTATSSQSFAQAITYIGSEDGATFYYAGYISNLRLVKGSVVYTSAFTPPTTPLTAITNTSLLLNFTNAGIIDNAEMNNLETVGNAQISTAQSKFGGGSMYFDGSGDWVASQAILPNTFGSGDFTVEMWIYPVSSATYGNLYCTEVYSAENVDATLQITLDASLIPKSGTRSAYVVTSSSALTANTWSHLAVSRSGSSWKMFINGTQVASATNSTSFVAGGFTTGILPRSTSNTWFNGYIDDLRITKGYARYTTSFTPQRSQWQDQ